MSFEIDLKKFYMSNCRMRKTNLFIQSCETLRRLLVLDLTPTPEDLKKIDQAIIYIQKLPATILDAVFSYIKAPNREYYTCYFLKNIEAWHVTLFTYNGQKQLLMDFANHNFDSDFFLDVCRKKLSQLEELKLPEQSQLSANNSKRLCASAPRLRKLSLLAVDIANFSMQFVANLHLEELELGGMVLSKPAIDIDRGFVDPQIAVLCREDSKVRTSLRVLKMGDYVNMGSYMLILRRIPNLEYLDVSHCTWLTKLPLDLQNRQFNLKKLSFCNLSEEVEKELAIGIIKCPLVISVDLTTNKISRRILSMLTEWRNLTTLDFKVVSSRFFDEGRPAVVFVEDNKLEARAGLLFANLTDVSIRDRRHFWLNNRSNLDSFLSICPQLSKLTFTECNGFDDQMALQTSRQLFSKNVQRIRIEYCNLLRPPGIRHFLAIPSLRECSVDLLLTKTEKRQFDVKSLEEEAERMGKTLKIDIIIRTLFHDLLSRLLT